MTFALPLFPLLGASDFATGVLFASKAFFQLASLPFISLQLVENNSKKLVLAGLAVEIAAVALFASFQTYSTWFFGRAVSGIASGCIMSGGLAIVKNLYADNNARANALGVSISGAIAGICFGPFVGGTLYMLNPSYPFLVLEALLGGSLVLAAMCANADEASTAEQTSTPAVSTTALLMHKGIFLPLICLVFANAAISMVESSYSRFATTAFGYNAGQCGALFLAVAVPTSICSAAAGPLGNATHRSSMVFIALVMQGVFTALAPKENFAVLLASFVGMGAGMGIIDGAVPAILGETADAHFMGTNKVYSLANGSVQLGFLIGPIVGNSIVSRAGFGHACAFFGWAIVLLAALIAISSCMCEPSQRKAKQVLV
jgi:predicted MFS family arabinose efflux permease